MKNSRILVRSEYEGAEEAALAVNVDSYEVFLVGGPLPGSVRPLSSPSSAEPNRQSLIRKDRLLDLVSHASAEKGYRVLFYEGRGIPRVCVPHPNL